MKHEEGKSTHRLAVSRRQAAEMLGISERLLWTLTNSKQVPHVRIGARVLYPVAELKSWLVQRIHGGQWRAGHGGCTIPTDRE